MKTVYLQYLLALLIFGMNGIVAHFITIDSAYIMLIRAVLGALFLALIMLFKRKKPELSAIRHNLLWLCLSGCALSLSWISVFEAYRLNGVSVSQILYYCGPAVVMVLSPVLFHERLTRTKLCGFVIVLFGMVLLNLEGFSGTGSMRGILLAMLGALFYAAMIIFCKQVHGVDGVQSTIVQFLSAIVMIGLFLFLRGGGFLVQIPRTELLPLLILGICNTGLGCLLYFSAVPKLPAQRVSILSYLDPMSALLFAALFLGEHVAGVQAFGCALILLGALGSELLPVLIGKWDGSD